MFIWNFLSRWRDQAEYRKFVEEDWERFKRRAKKVEEKDDEEKDESESQIVGIKRVRRGPNSEEEMEITREDIETEIAWLQKANSLNFSIFLDNVIRRGIFLPPRLRRKPNRALARIAPLFEFFQGQPI